MGFTVRLRGLAPIAMRLSVPAKPELVPEQNAFYQTTYATNPNNGEAWLAATGVVFVFSQMRFGATWQALFPLPTYTDDQLWNFTSVDRAVLENLPKLPPPTQAQQIYWSQNPLPPTERFPDAEPALEMLMRHQYPSSCEGKKFLAYKFGWSGAGSQVHVASWAMAVALQTGRIFTYDPSSLWQSADEDFCGATANPNCYFKPITNCSLPAGGSYSYASSWKLQLEEIPDDPDIIYIMPGSHSKPYPFGMVPEPFKKAFPNSATHISWWRALTTLFMWRPNVRYQHFLDQIYQRLFGETGFPQRAFGIHVRHGDKISEMALHPFEEYLQKAEQMKQTTPYLGMSDVIILFTDDPAVINQAHEWNSLHQNGTRWQFVHLNDLSAGVMGSGRWYIATAFMAAQADAWVFTTASNWCRVINELRLGRGKAKYAHIDIEPGEW